MLSRSCRTSAASSILAIDASGPQRTEAIVRDTPARFTHAHRKDTLDRATQNSIAMT